MSTNFDTRYPVADLGLTAELDYRRERLTGDVHGESTVRRRARRAGRMWAARLYRAR